MSSSRRDPRKAKLRRERIRRKKHALSGPNESIPEPMLQHPFATERAFLDVQALLEGQNFDNIDEMNAQLEELNRDGRVSERAAAWKRDDPKWRAQQLAYDALEAETLEDALLLVNSALELDPDNIDAQRLMVALLPMTTENRLHLLRELVAKADANLGEKYFEDNKGEFWSTISTRPYMRAKQYLGELLIETGHLEEGVTVYEQLMELDDEDHLGLRFQLIGLSLCAGRPEIAARLLDLYAEEATILGRMAWPIVIERWMAGDIPKAAEALARARRVNPYVEDYLTGRRRFPDEQPAFYQPGKPSEAEICAHDLAAVVNRNPGFRDWLRSQVH